MASHDELFDLADKLRTAAESGNVDDVTRPLIALEEAASAVRKSFSGSWQGYHSRVYYADFKTPPPGARFSQEWGLMDSVSMGSTGDWRENRPDLP